MATQLVTAMDEPWKPDRYRDTYTDRVNDLIEAKRRGHEVQQTGEPPEVTNVIDLFQTLQRSVDSARSPGRRINDATKSGRGRTTERATKKAPAKQSTTKKPAARRAPAKKAPAKKTAGARKAS